MLLDRAVGSVDIAGVSYLTFEGDAPLDVIGRSSLAFALFERDGDALRPVAMPATNVFDDDLLTIQRYQGKTNELFTRLLLNLTVANATLDGRRPVVLDPMAGRGTTLNHAAVLGWDGVGVEIDKADVDAYRTFLTTWLKNKRMPHKAKDDALRAGGGKAARLTVRFAPDRASFDAGDGVQVVAINGDARRVDDYLARNSADVIVTDLPYGVRHGAHRSANDRVRSPGELLAECLPAWSAVLRANGAIGLSFNTHTLPRADLVSLLADAGFVACADGPYDQLAHRVDQAIQRDVVIARRRP